MARLKYCEQGVRWRSGAQAAEADGRGSEGDDADSQRHDLGRRRSGSIGTALWMMLMFLKGAASMVFLASDSEGLEAWRQLTEKYEPKMRTRFAGVCPSCLSVQGDTTERVTAWEPEIATYERDSGKPWTMKSRLEQFCSDCPNHS